MTRLKGKVAIVTGGASGIGKGIATAFTKEGAKVAIVDFNAESGQKTAQELQEFGEKPLFIQADLSNHEKLGEIITKVVEHFGDIDILVNNAQASRNDLFENTTKDDFELSFNTGFYPTFYLMQQCFKYMKEKRRGKVINFASGAGINGGLTHTSYAAAKEAIRAISRVAANEWGPWNIQVNCISPIANSPGVQKWSQEAPEHYHNMIEKIPLRRLGDCEKDIGRTAVFLASEDSDYITGQTIMVDGGSIQLR
ncbi:SDR family NAD(P)-dependent oxidoreductase [Hazenella coriacea]|uniref:NAD(P)-dependent dehydrogenase (Short-subunit alcohol dehydrogenase family) n=1 Tax=Hazenella coriacea TaxID=1179467 RepID=A0A4R3L7H0_9BACL|nr:glucose 1-dehydrogenase [Hazenella coriacea]TCS95452.1 NAD(P)-dependent dehydrogenase (short-subunit alcohol dehydrogenase family) [Hazenella coriacea]